MSIGFVVLSDLHLDEKEEDLCNKFESLVKGILVYIKNCDEVFIVFSGDITMNGSNIQFELAYEYLKKLQEAINKKYSFCTVQFVLVPGNHDCLLNKEDANERQKNIKNLFEKKMSLADSEKALLQVQDNFWHFYSLLKGDTPENKICFQNKFLLKNDKTVIFNCYNTALCSTLTDKNRNLIIPESELDIIDNDVGADLVVSVYHHNSSYLTNENYNRKTFEKHIAESSDIILCGHEHRDEEKIISDIDEEKRAIYIESGQLGPDNSEFFILIYDEDKNLLNIQKMKYNDVDHLYEKVNIKSTKIQNYRKIINKEFSKEITSLKIPISHLKKIKLKDIYVYPDLHDLSTDKFCSSESLLREDFSVAIIEGEDQSGKTSLLNMYFEKIFNSSMYPLIIKGKRFDKKNIIENSFKKEYNDQLISFSEFEQKDSNKKILLIDNLPLDNIPISKLKKIIHEYLKFFGKIVITASFGIYGTDQLLEYSSEINIRLFSIKKFGYKKRNDLIKKFVKLEYIDKTDTTEQSKIVSNLFEKTTTFLGHQLVPAYPFFIISFLDNMQDMASYDLSRTSYAFCYRAMITNALSRYVSDEKIEGVFQFVSYLAYRIYIDKAQCSTKYFCDIFWKYEKEYIPSFNIREMQDKLERANILFNQDDVYFFRYKYIYYYFVSYYISNTSDNEVYSSVERLLENIQNEAEANILIFLVNQKTLSKKSIDWLVFNTCLPFEKYDPITLDKDDKLFRVLESIEEYTKITSIRVSKDPIKEKEKLYQKVDSFNDRRTNRYIESKDPAIVDLKKSLKLIKIIGQIVKNQQNVFKRDDLIDLIENSYLVAFRIISYSINLFEESRDLITLEVIKKIDKSGHNLDENKIRQKISQLFNMLLYRLCLQIFGSLAHSIGTENSFLFNKVHERINSPASRLIGFYIDTLYNYNEINFDELKSLLYENRKNPVITQIVNRRISNFVYYTPLKDKTIQKLESITKIHFIRKL